MLYSTFCLYSVFQQHHDIEGGKIVRLRGVNRSRIS